ncbi:uncharacterized protein [Antedon mediterranea]|uniref:uncharacterized protein n=1 Tax=Antedon mediterranea TaxID=105859 RepID=UPI003AF6E5D8
MIIHVFMYTNCDSILNKRDEFKLRMKDSDPDIILLTEILPKHSLYQVQKNELEIEEYNFYYSEKKRGIGIYVKSHLSVSVVDFESDFEESLWVEVYVGSQRMVIGCMYRSPNSTMENNFKIRELFGRVNMIKCDYLIVAGDFNFGNICWPDEKIYQGEKIESQRFLDIIKDLFWYQHITVTTRFRSGQEPSLLDLIFSKNVDEVEDINIKPPLGKSDHAIVTFKVEVEGQERREHTEARNYYRGEYDNMRQALKISDVKHFYEINSGIEMSKAIENKINECVSIYVPLRRKNVNTKKEWMNNELKNEIKKKHNKWNRFQKKKNKQSWSEFTIQRNRTTYLIKKTKAEFELKLARDVKTNPKNFWKYVKGKTKKKSGIPTLTDNNGKSVTEDTDKANLLNDSFASVFTIENTEDIPILSPRVDDIVLNIVHFSKEGIEEYLNKLDICKSPGPDKINSRVLKETSLQLADLFKHLFTKLMKQGAIPLSWGLADVIPIFKKGNKSTPLNYRPVSLTSLVCKTMETFIRNNIMDYMESNNLFTKSQHGFRPGRSCNTALLEALNQWTKWLDEGSRFDCVFLDFKKAFDSVPHKRLINKLKAYGIGGNLVQWIEAFLTNRSQVVVVNGVRSNSKRVTSGIPQGSVLGPLLFNLYINDLPDQIDSEITIFADDTKIFRKINNLDDAKKLQEDIDKLFKWSIKWQLPFNLDKCSVMHFGRKNNKFQYKMGHAENKKLLQWVSKMTDLGVVIDDKLTFESHVAQVAMKANKKLGIIYRSFDYLSCHSLSLLYKSIVRPSMEYCSTVWQHVFLERI